MGNEFEVKKGLAYLGYELSLLERSLFIEFENMLLEKGYRYLSLPSAGSWETIERQFRPKAEISCLGKRMFNV